MGKRAQNADLGVTFKSNDNSPSSETERSRKLSRQIHSISSSGPNSINADHAIPQFMRDTVSRSISKNPELLALIKPKRIRDAMAIVAQKPQVTKLSMLRADPQISVPKSDGTDSDRSGLLHSALTGSESDDNTVRPTKVGMITRSATVNPGALDKKTFTFKPKMSAASAKIVDQLGSDFMSRQQKHLEKQKRLIQQADSQYRSQVFGQVSPILGVDKVKVKSVEKQEDSCTPEETDTEVGDVNVHGSKSNHSDPSQGVLPALDVIKSSSVGSLSKSEPSGIKHLLGPSKTNLGLKRSNSRLKRRRCSIPPETHHNGDLTQSLNTDDGATDLRCSPTHIGQSRSKTMPPPTTGSKGSKKLASLNLERIRMARELADKAIKNKKIFVIQGPYPRIRESLRKRGWVERFLKMQGPPKKSPKKKKVPTATLR